MKTKFFTFGFFTAVFLFLIIGFSIFKYSQNYQDVILNKELKENSDSLSIKIISFKDLNLSKFHLIKNNKKNKFDQKIIIINFWATWCAPCVKELPNFQKLINKSDLSNIKFIFASAEDEDKIVAFSGNHSDDFNLPLYSFKKGEISNMFNHSSIPTTYIINTETKIAFQIDGIANWNSKIINNLIKTISK